MKAGFVAIIRDLAARLQAHAAGGLTEDRALALPELCVSALGIVRSAQDESLGNRILAACRDQVAEGLIADDGVQTPATPTRKRK